ncbi:hypothetical protein TUMEXPCC7403_01380 [Tumidithrix helvetica PCC 7403]|uniref:hypothetical protein n=1 Tax=Tumidithrix helvetica TaxID=3457545 RepID=UPI003CB98B1A
MYQPLENRFRPDLVVTRHTKKQGNDIFYLVKDPISREIYKFKEEDYFLCALMNGQLSIEDIIAAFNEKFSTTLSQENFNEFSKQISNCKLLERLETQSLSIETENLSTQDQNAALINRLTEFREIEEKRPKPLPKDKSNHSHQGYEGHFFWLLPQSEFVFSVLAFPFKPFGLLFKLLTWAMILGFPIACLILCYRHTEFLQDLLLRVQPLPYLAVFVFNLLMVSFPAKVVQGIVATNFGVTIKKFGMVTIAGFFPRFSIDRTEIWKLDRSALLWTLSMPLVVRVVLFVFGMFIWYSTRTTGTQLSVYANLLAVTSLIDFILDGLPFWPADGYVWMIAYFRVPELFGRSSLVWDMTFRRRPLPKNLSRKERLALQAFGALGLVLFALLLIVIMFSMSKGLATDFATQILGRAAAPLLFCVMAIAALSQFLSFWLNKGSKNK